MENYATNSPMDMEEPITTSEDKVEQVDVIPEEPKRPLPAWNDRYVLLRPRGKKSKDKNRAKKKKKSSKKKHRKERCEIISPIPIMDSLNIFRQQMLESTRIREGYNIPPSMELTHRRPSAFIFGESYRSLVGKHQEDDGHIAVFGGSSSGKTSSIAIPTVCTWKGPIFSFDFKGDVLKWATRRHPIILYMIDGAKNYFWYDPFYLLRQDSENNLIQNAREIAQAIIPLPPNTTEPFWVESARSILTGAIVYFFKLGIGFIDSMVEIKTTSMSDLLQKISRDPLAAVCVNPDLGLSPKTVAGVSMVLHNHIFVFATDSLIQEVLSPSEDDPKAPIRWEDLEKWDIFIRVDQSRLDQWGGVMRLMLTQLIRTLERRPEKYEPEGAGIKPTLLLLDEFPQYGKVDVFTSALRILRSKNVTISIFCQSLADLDEIYGKVTRRAILDNCPYKAILNASDAESQKYFSDLVGTVDVPSRGIAANFDEYGRPLGYSASINESRTPIIYPHEFASLKDVVLLHPGPERFCRLEKITRFRQNPTLLIEGK